MLFRCSVCKGEFDVEPDPRKPTIFCTHCGAALKTGKPGQRAPSTYASAPGGPSPLDALTGGGDAGAAPVDSAASPLDQLAGAQAPAQPALTSQPVYASQPAYPQAPQYAPGNPFAPPPPPPANADPLTRLAYAEASAPSYSTAPAYPAAHAGARLPGRARRKKGNAALIITLSVVAGVILIVGLVVLIIGLSRPVEEPAKPKLRREEKPPGELFPDKN